MIRVIFYHTALGACPVESFLDSLSGKQSQKVLWVLRLIQEINPVPTQYLKKLVNTDDIWEVRIQVGNDTFRLLGFFVENNHMILTNGFVKKTQKTPPQEIKLAKQRKQDYLNRRLNDE